MDRFYPGPEWSGNQEASQPIQNSSAHTPAEKKTSDNLSVKSKLRKLAEFRSRSKEFGSNDSLHLNPLNRSFSDPWLLKSDQREMDNELDLSKSASASSSNLTKEKNECRKLPMMSNGLTSAGSESYVNRLASAGSQSYVNTLWQQQLQLMQKSVNAYQKMSNLDMSNGTIQNPYLPYPGYNYTDISPKNIVGGKTPSNKSSVNEEILGKPQLPIGSTLQNHHLEQSSEIHYAQHPLTKLPPIQSLQNTHETTVHWKPTSENVTKTHNYHYQPSFDLSQEKQNLQFDQNNQDLSDIKHKKSDHADKPLDFKTDDKDGFSKEQQKGICHQHPVDFSKSQQKEMPSNFPMDFTKRQHELPSQLPMDFVKGQQNKLQTHFPMDFVKGQQNKLPSQYPMDFSKGQQNTLPSQYPNDFSKGQQNTLPSQYPNELSKGQQNKLLTHFPMDFSKGQQNTLPNQYPNDFSKGQQNTLPSQYPMDFSKGQQHTLPSQYPNDLSKGQQNALPSQYPNDLSKGQQNALPSQYPMDFSKGQQNTLPTQYSNDLSKGQQNKLPSQYPMDFSKGPQNTLSSQYPTDFSKGQQNEREIQSMMEFNERQHNDLDNHLPVQFNKGQQNYQLANSTSVDFRNSVHPMSTKGNNSQPYPADLSSQALTDFKDKQNAFFGRSFSHEKKKTDGKMLKQKQEAKGKVKQEKPFYPADNYLNGAFYNLPPPNKEVKKKKKIHSEQATSTQEKITPTLKGDNTNGQYPYMQYPYLPNYYSDPHMMKALIAHQKMYMGNTMEQHNQLKRKNPVLEEMDKQKIKRTKKSGNKMKKQEDTDKTVIHTQQDQFKNKYLSTDIKKSLKANSEALSQIKNRVQEILNTAASEMHSNSHTEEKSQIPDIHSTASEIEMDVDFLDAHESLLTSDTIADPCCGHCEKLGMRYSPLCEEKSKRSSVCDIPNLICDDKDISLKPSAITSTVDIEKSTCNLHKMLEKCDEVGDCITTKSDVYSFSDEYSDMNTTRLSLPLLSNTKSNGISTSSVTSGISTSSVTSEQQNLNQSSSTMYSVSKNTDSVSSEHWQENNAFMPQTILNQNNLLPVSENSTTQAKLDQTNLLWNISNSITQVSSSVRQTSASQATSSQFNPFINGLRKDLFSITHSGSESNTSNIPLPVVNTHSVETTSISTTLAKTLASSDGTCVTSVSSVASSNNSVFPSTAVRSSILACNVSEKVDDINFKVPESAKYLPPISAISRLENNLSNDYFDRSFENEELNEKLDDLSGLLDTTENSDDEKENLFQNVASKSFEEVDDILHNIKPNECLPESGLDQLAWVADHIQKIKEKVTGEDDDITARLKNNEKLEIPQCTCRGPGYIPTEDIESPYYTHLGAARSIQGIRDLMEERTGVTGKALRIEKIRYTNKEGKSSQGCPIAKWIIRRSSVEEKYLVVVKQRPGHFCETAVLMVVAVAWEGIEQNMAADMYDYLRGTLTSNGFETERRCGTNERKTCACQGINLSKRGASFSFGCSWSMYFNGCKFARSQSARKFKLKDTSKEGELESRFQKLATDIAPLYQKVAPDAYSNQIAFEDQALDCRLGLKEGRPFTGVTSCVDFCAHAHKDLHNMNNGSTVVVTLTKHRGIDKPDDEQLHVLPLYVMDMADEHGSTDAQYEKIKSGALEVLNHYQMEARIRATPLTPSRRKKKGDKKGSPGRKKGSVNANKTSSPITPKNNVTNSQDLNSSSDLYFRSESDKSNSGTPQKPSKTSTGLSSQTYEELMNMASQPELNDLYDSFWNYFYSFGSFPPADFMASMNMKAKDIVKKSKTLNKSSKSRQQSLDMNHPVQNQTNSQTLSGEITPEKMCSNFSGIVKDIQNMSPTFKNGALEHNTSDIERQPNTLPIDLSHKQESFVNPLSNSSNSFHSSDPNRSDVESKPNAAFDSPLHLLSEAVSMRTKEYGSNYPSQDLPQNTRPYHHVDESSLNTAVHHDQRWGQYNYAKSENVVSEQCKNSLNPVQQNIVDNSGEIDQNILKCEMEYNENAFADSQVGGVAIALCHGSVLFEVAKRELHATTGLKNPNRYSPTRISLVFYQHKNLINEHHGMYVYEKKCERVRQKRLQDIMNGTIEKPVSPAEKIKASMKKKKSKKEEKFDIMKTSAAQYKYMWDTTTVRADAMTTDSVVTRWIDPQPMITGPYQRWI